VYTLLFTDDKGNLYSHPDLGAAGRTGDKFVALKESEMVELPEGSSLVMIPGGIPVGAEGREENSARTLAPVLLEEDPWQGGKVFAAAALLPQGYTRTLLPAYYRGEKENPLPLMGYAAVAAKGEKIYAAAVKTEDPATWDPVHYNTEALPGLIEKRLQEFPRNRIIRHLSRCALEYQCYTAQNIFYRRWEGGIPVSPECNAGCLGCISKQPSECCPSPQERIKFRPSASEIVDVAVYHLEGSGRSIISFGQGCEGEPSLAADLIAPAVRRVRARTGAGTINMNTNGGNTDAVLSICEAGLDSIRVGLISAREETYRAYHRPRGYTLAGVKETLRRAREMGVYVAINLLVFPGLTDRLEETDALVGLLREVGVDQVQLRNLNIDPDFLCRCISSISIDGQVLGIPRFIEVLRERVPGLTIGSYSREARRGRL